MTKEILKYVFILQIIAVLSFAFNFGIVKMTIEQPRSSIRYNRIIYEMCNLESVRKHEINNFAARNYLFGDCQVMLVLGPTNPGQDIQFIKKDLLHELESNGWKKDVLQDEVQLRKENLKMKISFVDQDGNKNLKAVLMDFENPIMEKMYGE